MTPRLLNEVKLLVGVESEPRVSLVPAPKIVVLDAFTGGGAQADSLRTERHFTMVEAVTGVVSTISPIVAGPLLLDARRLRRVAALLVHPTGGRRSGAFPGEGPRRLCAGRQSSYAEPVSECRATVRLAELLSRRQQFRAARIVRVLPNNYDLSLEYARADFNQLHRLEMFGTIPIRTTTSLGLSASLATGRPYSLTTGLDTFNEGTANARPDGVARNSLVGPAYANVDARFSHDFVLATVNGHQRMWTVGVDAFNALNHVNFSYFVGNQNSPFFGQAVSSAPARRIQFSLRFRY